MKLIEPMRVWWQQRTGEEETPFDGDTPAWVISMVVHAALLVIFAMVALGPVEPAGINLEVVAEPKEEELAELIPPQEVYFDDAKVENIGAMSEHADKAAMAVAAVEAVDSVALEMEVVVPKGDLVFDSSADVAKAPNTGNQMVKGISAGVGNAGAEGAVDRITHEILLSLEQRKTLVVWVFDQSGSLQRQRAAIRERFDRIYEELGVLEAAKLPAFAKHEDKPLLTSVVAFGENFSLLTPKPTDAIEEITAAVEKIKNDTSGTERVFAAVHETAKQFRAYRTQDPRRNVMIVVVTDEAGDDQELLDASVDQCRKYQMPVYVVGVPAPFGRKMVDIKYVDPDPQYDQSEQWVPVHQGPESFLPEGIKLAFSADEHRDEPIDSGFGPYGLTRLCYETGGIYFAVHPNRNKGGHEVERRETAELAAHLKYFFDPQIMRRYQPDYVSTDEYKKLLSENKARYALVQAANLSGGAGMASPALNFPKEGEAEFANLLSEAQQQAAKLEPRVDQLYQTLAVGEPDRPKLAQPRWQAGYDLAMGRTLAVMVRTKVYNGMLAKAKQGMKFENEKNDTWKLVPADEVSVGSALEKQAEQARMYLNRVVKDHEGTPWAMLAAKELEKPIGFKWEEAYTGVQAMKEAIGDGDAAAAAMADDKMKKLEKPKQKRTPPL